MSDGTCPRCGLPHAEAKSKACKALALYRGFPHPCIWCTVEIAEIADAETGKQVTVTLHDKDCPVLLAHGTSFVAI